MPFLNKVAWRSAQHDCADLRCAYPHLPQGTHPSCKARNLKYMQRYLNVASIDDQGLLVVYKQDPGVPRRSLIVVPVNLLPGIITALHYRFKHASKHQLKKIFNHFFFGIKSDSIINDIVEHCALCNSMKVIITEIFEQSSSVSPSIPGQIFFADILRHKAQKICFVCDVHSTFTTASIINDETADTLRVALLINSTFF